MEDHVHRGYKHKKRLVDCAKCKRLANRADKVTRMRREAGTINPLVQSSTSRKHIKSLVSKGYGLKVIAREVGLTDQTIREILHKSRGPRSMVFKSTEDALREMVLRSNNPEIASPRQRREDHLPSDIAVAAIQGLMLRGWTQIWIAEQVHCSRAHISKLNRGVYRNVTVDMHNRLVALAKKYGTTDGPNKKIRLISESKGFKSTAMYDELL